MHMPLSTYLWFKKYEKANEALWKEMAAIQHSRRVSGADLAKIVGPLATLNKEYREYVLPAVESQRRLSGKKVNPQRLGGLLAGLSGALLLAQVGIYYAASHSSYRGFWECLLARCSQEALYEPLVWLSLLGVVGGLAVYLWWAKIYTPLMTWLQEEK